MKFYAGIGSRQTPSFILQIMTDIAKQLDKQDYILRSGNADGADSAFADGTDNKEIFIATDCTPAAMELSSKYHPNWNACNHYVRKLHGRNSMILLGYDLKTPVDFVICWTPDGRDTGGTGQAIRIAADYNIDVYNLYHPDHLVLVSNLY